MKQLTKPRTNSVEYSIEQRTPEKRFIIKDRIKPSSNGANHPNPNGMESDSDIPAKTGTVDISKYVSEEEYWATYYDHPDGNYEWNNGYLEEKPMANLIQFQIYSWFLELLRDFLYVNKVGKLTGLEIGFRLSLAHKTTTRKPDIGLVLNSNPIPAADEDRTYQGIFDICIESLSDSTVAVVERDTVHKKAEYAQVGVPEYYILDDSGDETVFYSLNPFGVYVPIQPVNGVIQSRVVPGFQFRVDDLYTCPRLATLALDPVYSAFASPEYRVERRRADESDRLAEEERQRADESDRLAEEERQRADESDRLAVEERQRAEEERQRADESDRLAVEERQRADHAEQLAEEASQRATQERQRAEEMERLIKEERQRAEKERVQAETARLQIVALAEQLRAAGINPQGLDMG